MFTTLKEITHQFFAIFAWIKATLRAENADNLERGDVPGWVMITMMTAILVAGLLLVAQDALIGLFNRAMSMIG